MCGIAGYQGEFDAGLLEKMSATIAHRGPDGHGSIRLRGPGPRATVGLAHRRLAIIDRSANGAQPMMVDCPCCGGADPKGLVLTYNGEIYNFRELREELRAKGHRFRSATDSEVLVHLYGEMGPEMLSRLNGIYAFALFDGRETGRPPGVRRGDVLLARDPIGVKPLYFARTAEGVLFASELKAILRHSGLSRELDPAAIHYYLAYLWVPAPFTVLRNVQKLRPGHAMILRGGDLAREWRYYDLPYGTGTLDRGEADVAAELREGLESAVRRQMVADVPVGAFLSGGLDSSSIVAMMRKVAPDHRPTCFSIGFRGQTSVEGNPLDLPFARRVADHLDVDLRVLEVEPDCIRHLERMLYFLDEPQADPAPINALLIAEQARREGIPVLLSGAGGDDIFSGYRRHRAVSFERYWQWLPTSARAGVAGMARWLSNGVVPAMAGRHVRRAAKALVHADLPTDERMVSYFWWGTEQLRRTLYSPALSAELDGVTTAAPLLESLSSIRQERAPLNRMLYLDAKHFLSDHNLNYTDRMGMAAGVEVRVPLLDLELVALAARVPPRMKQKGRVGKAIFKRAMEPDLPRSVIYRAKTGFGAPLRRWLRNELRDHVELTLSEAALERRGLFQPAAVRRLIALESAGKVDGAYTIFALMCLELWCRMFVDGEPPAEAPVA